MKKVFPSLLILLIIPLTLFLVFQNHDWRRAAFGKPARIIVDASQPGSIISPALWQNFAQGGEEKKDMIAPAVNEIKQLSPQIIRIDHIFDYYVNINGDQYNFSNLDKVVRTILSTGAKPMFSLSYMPQSLSSNGQVTSPPKDWYQWKSLVSATISHYSGRNGLNINGVYYEVWNEPDLFGGWHCGKNPNYLTLYYQTVSAAQSVSNVNSFKIGGPATTGFYPTWVRELLKFCSENNLRIDFVSWHRYAKDLEKYQEDFEKLNRILTDYPKYFSLERLITEFGPSPENSPWYDSNLSAAHTLAGTIKLLDKVHRVFSFEIKDGPDPKGSKFWGRWGLLTHESHGLVKKPRYYAYQFLNQIQGNRLPLQGEGSWVSAVATKEKESIKVLVVNYDPSNKHYESPPIILKNIPSGRYLFSLKYFLGNQSSVKEEITNNSSTVKRIVLPPNSAAILEWRKISY